MIKAVDVYNTALSLAKKDQRGGAFNVDEFNYAASLVNMELYNSLVSKYETSKEISELLNPFKVRGASITLTSGVGQIPRLCNRIIGMPYVAHPWGRITATATVTIVNEANAKVRVTSADHGLKDGDVITATGLSVHTITAQPIHYIDKNTFWVDVNYTGADVITNAAWTVVGASYKEVDYVTEEELATRLSDSLTKPTIQNPVYVLNYTLGIDTVATGTISAFGYQALNGAGAYPGMLACLTSTAHGLSTGDLVYINNIVGGVGLSVGYYPVTVIDADQFVIYAGVATATSASFSHATKQSIVVYPNTILSVLINYLKLPNTPFLDYYVDVNYAIQFLEDDRTHGLVTGEAYRDGTAGTTPATVIYSTTVNWDWDADALPQIVYMILQKMGINLENINVAQLATQLSVKEEAQA